jgi:2-dehydro-3-deoxygluconokinase
VTDIEVLTVGEAMLRFSVPASQRLESADATLLHVGGAEANTAAVLAGLDRKVVWASRLPDTPLGRRVDRELRAHGVDTSVSWAGDERVGLYFVELLPPPLRPTVIYDRRDSAASRLTGEDVPWALAGSARVIHLTGILPALSATTRTATSELVTFARDRGILLSIDVNFRAKLWTKLDAATFIRDAAVDAAVLTLSREDARDLFGIEGSPIAIAETARTRLGSRAAVVTLGAEGAAWSCPESNGQIAGVPIREFDKFGAGDAFAAGVVDGLLDGDLEAGVRRGVILGALAAGTSGDLLTVHRHDVDGVGYGRAVDR